jgi:EmrB/QacA subfamily drug resistance transporter
MQHSFHAAASGLQWTIDGYVLLRASTLFLSGATADRFGRRRCFSAGLTIFVAGSLACGLAPNLGTLIGFRCFQGFGSAVLTPSSLAIVTNTFQDRRQRALAIGIWSTTASFAQSAGPVLGGFLVQSLGWRSVFLVNVPIGALALVGVRRLRESKAERPRPFDVPGQASLGIGLFCLTYALIAGPTTTWASPVVIALFVASAFSWFAFVVIERRTAHPMLHLGYFKNRSLSGSGLLAMFVYIANGGFLFFNTLYLQEVRGFSPLHAGLMILPVSGAGLVLSPLSGHLTGTRGPRLPATVAAIFIAASMGSLALMLGTATPIWSLLIGYFLLGVGTGLVNTPITNGAISGMPASQAGVAGAVATMGRQIGTNLGVALVGAVVLSVATRGVLSGAHPGVALAHAHGQAFVNGVRDGDLLCFVLSLAGVATALWAYSGRSAIEQASEITSPARS